MLATLLLLRPPLFHGQLHPAWPSRPNPTAAHRPSDVLRRTYRTSQGQLPFAVLSATMFLIASNIAWAQGAGADWTTPAGTLEGTRFSSLKQINPTNVAQLKEEFSFKTGIEAGHEGAPLVVGDLMYVVSPFPNKLFALDLTRPGHTRWVFEPKPDLFSKDKACCDIVSRGAVYANGKVIFNALDNTTLAVDALSGRELWRTNLGDVRIGQTMTMAPVVVGSNVIVGNSGAELGVRGFIAALDLNTGKEKWRAWSTGPDTDVKIGANFKPFYPKDQGANLGTSTWPGNLWIHGGGTVWGWISSDGTTLFHGTANPGVWNADMRPGDNKWSTTQFARNPDTGDALWAYQMTPHDAWDYDGVNEGILADLTIGKTLVRFDRNGFAYTFDRSTGKVLVAKKYVEATNWASSIDLTTGLPIENPAKRTHEGIVTTDICPAAPGGKDEQPAAFSPLTQLFYVPTNNLCMDYEGLKVNYIQGTPFVGASVTMKAGPGGNRGEFIAWDAATGTKKWGIKERFPVWSGALATAGNVVFYGTLDRWFKAVDAVTGNVLFQVQLESGIVGHPMTFLGPDGMQRVAVYSGPGGWAGAIVPGRFAVDDPYAALGAVGALSDLPRFTPPGGAVHVFRIGGSGDGRSGPGGDQ